MASSEKTPSKSTSERRRRSRVGGKTTGWVIPENGKITHPWEVHVNDVSRHGVGFESFEKFEDGDVMRIRIGRGPLELAKRVRVVRCRPAQDGKFQVGGEFL